MSWRNVSNTPLYGGGGVVKQAVANPGVWSGIGKAGSTIAGTMMKMAEEEVQEEAIGVGTDETMDYGSLEGWTNPSTGAQGTAAEYDALVKERNQDTYYDEGFDDEWQYGGSIPKASAGTYIARRNEPGGEANYGRSNPWDTGQEDEVPLAQQPGFLDIMRKTSRGLDNPDDPGFWDKMDLDNAIGAMYGAGKVGLGALGAGAQYIGKGINKYNTAMQNKIKTREEAQRQEGYKRQQAMIDSKAQAGVEGKAHTDEQLRREMLNKKFIDDKEQERLNTPGQMSSNYEAMEKAQKERKYNKKMDTLKFHENRLINELQTGALSTDSTLSPEQQELIKKTRANRGKRDADFMASMEGMSIDELSAMFPLEAGATVGGDNAEINRLYQQKQIHDKAFAGHVEEAELMPKPTKRAGTGQLHYAPRVIDYDNPEVKQNYREARESFMSDIQDDPETAGKIAEFDERVRQRNLKMDDPEAYKREMLGRAGASEDDINSLLSPVTKHPYLGLPDETDPLIGIGKKTKKTSLRHPSLGPGETDWKGNPVGSTQVSDSEALAMTIPGVNEGDIDEIKFWQDESKALNQRVDTLTAEENEIRNKYNTNALADQNKARNEQLNQAMVQQGYGTQTLSAGNQPIEGGQSKRGFSSLRGRVAGWLDKIKGSFETGGYLPRKNPWAQPNYSMGGDIAQANRQQEQGSQKMLMAGQQSDGQITDDTIRHNRMKRFIAELNQQSPMFIDTILQR